MRASVNGSVKAAQNESRVLMPANTQALLMSEVIPTYWLAKAELWLPDRIRIFDSPKGGVDTVGCIGLPDL